MVIPQRVCLGGYQVCLAFDNGYSAGPQLAFQKSLRKAVQQVIDSVRLRIELSTFQKSPVC
jgi:hypothetical protein